jgi:hypothetical protein
MRSRDARVQQVSVEYCSQTVISGQHTDTRQHVQLLHARAVHAHTVARTVCSRQGAWMEVARALRDLSAAHGCPYVCHAVCVPAQPAHARTLLHCVAPASPSSAASIHMRVTVCHVDLTTRSRVAINSALPRSTLHLCRRRQDNRSRCRNCWWRARLAVCDASAHQLRGKE